MAPRNQGEGLWSSPSNQDEALWSSPSKHAEKMVPHNQTEGLWSSPSKQSHDLLSSLLNLHLTHAKNIKLVGKLVAGFVGLLVLFKCHMIISDQMKTENSGEVLLGKPIMKSAERLDRRKIKPYLLEPRVHGGFFDELRKYESTGNKSLSGDLPVLNVATLVLSAPKNFEDRVRMRFMSIGRDTNVADIQNCTDAAKSRYTNVTSSGYDGSASYVNVTTASSDLNATIERTHLSAKECRKKRIIKQSVIFLLGAVEDESVQHLIQEENRMFGDILQISVKDSYGNLPFKTIAGLEYVMENRKDTDVILKIDDDLIIYEGALRDSLLSVYPMSPSTIYCYQLLNTSPWKRRLGYFGLSGTDKLIVDHESWPADKYPDHCLGWVYALTPKTATKIVDMVDYTPRHKTDDLYVTGLLRTRAGVKMEMLSTSPFLYSGLWRYISRCRFMAWAYHLLFYDVALEGSGWPSLYAVWSVLWNIPIQIVVEQGTCIALALALVHNKRDSAKLLKILFFVYFTFV